MDSPAVSQGGVWDDSRGNRKTPVSEERFYWASSTHTPEYPPVAQGRTGDTERFLHVVTIALREQCDQGHMVDGMAQHEVAFTLEH